MNIPPHQMHEATYAQFKAWWPLFTQYVPQYVAKCTALSQWEESYKTTARWNDRLATMQYETAKVMNGLGMVPGIRRERK